MMQMIPFHSAEPIVQFPSHFNQDDDVTKISAIDEQHYPALVSTYDAYDDDLSAATDLFPAFNRTYAYAYDDDDSDGGPQRYSKFLKCDCKWTGCDPECKKTHKDEDMSLDSWNSDNELLNPNSVWPVRESYEIQPYTPDSDHCYYASKQVISEKVDSLDILKNIPTPPASSSPPSETTTDDEDEVDVVTVPDEYLAPVIAYNFEAPRRNSRSQRIVKKSQRTQQLSAKSLKAAMKRTRAKNLSMCRTYKRRKVGDHRELIPSSSNVSSTQSSRCSSDVEDVGKRNNHNCIERERRASLRTALQNLRVLIPNLQNNDKAPKVLILNSATDLINRLKIKDRTLDESKQSESKRQSKLIAKLNQLRMKLKI